jgi:serine/threonine protein kinase
MQRRIGRYDILERLGAGGMAEVYKVSAAGVGGFQKIVALKRILPALAAEPRFIQNFIDEARIAAELAHPNIVGVLDFGRADGELYLTMELVEGIDLRALMAAARTQGRALPVPEVCRIVAELAAGLEHAHGKRGPGGEPLGIAHCDVSPSNVMVSRDGAVKVLDFGVARANFVAALEQRRLRGKPRYMAPEQTLGEPATAAADVFALGILGWELATGRALFRGVDLRDTVRRVRTAEIPRLEEARPELPRALADAIHAALQRRVSDRCGAQDLVDAAHRHAGSARALAELVATLAAPELHTPPPTVATRADGTARRPRLSELDDESTRADPDARDLVVELEDEPELDAGGAAIAAPPPPRRRATTTPPPGRAPSWRRRAVIAALLLDRPRAGAIADAARRAVQHGASIWRQGDAALELAFGLEVAGDDELDATLAWTREVDEHLARDAPRLGVVCGVEVQLGTWPEAAAAHATALARAAEPGAPRVVTSDTDDVPALGLARLESAPVPCPEHVLATINVAQRSGALVWARGPDHLAWPWADDAAVRLPGIRVVACPAPHARRPFGVLTALGTALGGPLRDAALSLQVSGALGAHEIDARVEHHAHDLLERWWPDRDTVTLLAGVGGADRASLRVIGRARHLAAAAWRDGDRPATALVLLGDADDDPWPREPGFALRPELVTIAAEASVAGSPLAATPPAWRAIAGALAAAGGSLRQRLLLELVELDASALEAALRDMSAAGLLQLQHGAVRVAAPAAIAPLVDHARVPEVAQRLATLLRARLRAGREESLELLAQVSARAHSADAPRAWLDAARARLSAGDARGAAACVGAAGVPADAEFERTLRGTLDARLAAVEEAPATPPLRRGSWPDPRGRHRPGARRRVGSTGVREPRPVRARARVDPRRPRTGPLAAAAWLRRAPHR